MSTANYPFRKVNKVTLWTNKYNRPGEGCNRFELECGHVIFAKQSDGMPRRKRCRECFIESRVPKRVLP